ncbi:MAG: glycoside hydrolase family 5 protein [Ruminococcus sp.]|nr:glycoside hydrolase family 5 protein [Ruminococcus sp.]
MNKLMKRLVSIASAAALLFAAAPRLSEETVSAADVNSMTAAQICADMKLGWNLGNSLEANGTNDMTSEVSWSNPRTTKDMLRAVRAKGFTTIRIPVTWGNHMNSSNTIDAEWMKRVHTVVDWAMAEGFYVILNSHHEEWNRPTNANYSAASVKLKSVWKQISESFASYDKHLIFEGMNEPRNYNSTHEWDGGTQEMRDVINKLNADFVSAVRATGGINATRALMIPTYAASNTYIAMSALTLPSDSNLIVSVHAYTPYMFSMNGQKTFNSSMESQLASFFKDLDSCFVSKGIPVCIGEFGASNYNNQSERVKWAKSFASKAIARKVPLVIWDNNYDVNSGDSNDSFGLFDRDNLTWYSSGEQLVNALVSAFGLTSKTFVPSVVYDGVVPIKGSNWWAEATISKNRLLCGYSASEVSSVTLSCPYKMTVMNGSDRKDGVFEYTIQGTSLPSSLKVAISFNDNKVRPVNIKVNLKNQSSAQTAAFLLAGSTDLYKASAFTGKEQKVTVNISGGCSAFTDLGSIRYSSSAPSVTVKAIVVNGEYLVPVGKKLTGSSAAGGNTLASLTGEGKVNGKIFEATASGTTFGFYGNGGGQITFKAGGSAKSVTKLEYILTDSITPALLGAQEYNQFSALDSSGQYAQRHVVLIKKNLAAQAKSATVTYSGGVSRTVTGTGFYRSLHAGGKTMTAPDGYIYLVTVVKNIPNSSAPMKSGSSYKGLTASCVLNY